MSRKKQRSAKQQAQSAGNLAQINGPNKENQPPKTHLVPASALEAVLKRYDHERKRGDDYKRRLNNEHRKHGWAVAQNDKLQADAAVSKSKLKEVVGILADTDTKLAKACSELTCIQESVKSLKKEKVALKKLKQYVPARIALAVNKEMAKAANVTL